MLRLSNPHAGSLKPALCIATAKRTQFLRRVGSVDIGRPFGSRSYRVSSKRHRSLPRGEALSISPLHSRSRRSWAALAARHTRTIDNAMLPAVSSDFGIPRSIRLKASSAAFFAIIGRPAPLVIEDSPKGIVRLASAQFAPLALWLKLRSIKNNSSPFRTSPQGNPGRFLASQGASANIVG